MTRHVYLVCISFAVGCGSQPPATNTSAPTPPPTPVKTTDPGLISQPIPSPEIQPSSTPLATPIHPEPATPAADVTMVTLQELADLAEAKESLRKKYSQSKSIQVTVKIDEVGINDEKLVSVACRIKSGKATKYTFLLQPDQMTECWVKLSSGQTVTLRTGSEQFYSLWVITELGPNPAPILRAEDLAAEFTNDAASAVQKYYQRGIYVTGRNETKVSGTVVLSQSLRDLVQILKSGLTA